VKVANRDLPVPVERRVSRERMAFPDPQGREETQVSVRGVTVG